MAVIIQRMTVTADGCYDGWFLQRTAVTTGGVYYGQPQQRTAVMTGGCYNGLCLHTVTEGGYSGWCL